MLLSAVSVLVVAQSSSEIAEGLMYNPVYPYSVALFLGVEVYCTPSFWCVAYFRRSRCETSDIVVVFGNIPNVRAPIRLPPAARGGRGAEVELWADSPFW